MFHGKVLATAMACSDTTDAWESDDDLPSFFVGLEERRLRAEKLNRIQIFLDSAVKREEELEELLDWLSFTSER